MEKLSFAVLLSLACQNGHQRPSGAIITVPFSSSPSEIRSTLQVDSYTVDVLLEDPTVDIVILSLGLNIIYLTKARIDMEEREEEGVFLL